MDHASIEVDVVIWKAPKRKDHQPLLIVKLSNEMQFDGCGIGGGSTKLCKVGSL